MKNLALQQLGVSELSANEMNNITGGGSGFPWVAFLTQVANNWSDIKKGFVEGYNAKI